MNSSDGFPNTSSYRSSSSSIIRSRIDTTAIDTTSMTDLIGTTEHTGNGVKASIPTFWTAINIVYIVIGLTGIVGNLFACFVIASYGPLRRRPANYFIINQCFLDLTIACVLIVNAALSYVTRNTTGSSIYPVCYLINTRIFFTSVFVASIWNLSSLAVERYLKIVHPIRHKLAATRTKILGACIAAWVFGFAYRSVATLPLASVVNGVCFVIVFPSPAYKTANGLGVFLGDFLLPMSIITFCYVRITAQLRRLNPTLSPDAESVGGGGVAVSAPSSLSSTTRKNIIMLLAVITLVFLVTVGPRQMTVLYYAVLRKDLDINSTSYLVCLCLNYSNCAINPFIYMFKYADFRQGARVLLGISNQVGVVPPAAAVEKRNAAMELDRTGGQQLVTGGATSVETVVVVSRMNHVVAGCSSETAPTKY